MESAGQAAVRLPSSSIPSELAAYHLWTADTGATAHMTPHRHWFQSYTPCSVPISVANGQVIYAAGKGTVEFVPVHDGRILRSVVFSGVLHVPLLNQNLFSVLTLSENHDFCVEIHKGGMDFKRARNRVFSAAVGADKVALLSGSTVVQPEHAHLASALSYDILHHRLGHISLGRLQTLQTRDMLSGVAFPSLPTAPSYLLRLSRRQADL